MVALDAYIQEYKTWVDSITVNYSDVVKTRGLYRNRKPWS